MSLVRSGRIGRRWMSIGRLLLLFLSVLSAVPAPAIQAAPVAGSARAGSAIVGAARDAAPAAPAPVGAPMPAPLLGPYQQTTTPGVQPGYSPSLNVSESIPVARRVPDAGGNYPKRTYLDMPNQIPHSFPAGCYMLQGTPHDYVFVGDYGNLGRYEIKGKQNTWYGTGFSISTVDWYYGPSTGFYNNPAYDDVLRVSIGINGQSMGGDEWDADQLVTITRVGAIPDRPDVNCTPQHNLADLPSEPGCQQNVPAVGEPISLGDGSWFFDIPCMQLRGAGLPIQLGLRYSTRVWHQGQGDSGVGRGWTTSYSRRLLSTPQSCGSGCSTPAWTLLLESGERHLYVQQSDGTIAAPARNFTRLERVPASTQMRLIHPHGIGELYDANGELLRIEDRVGNATEFSWQVLSASAATRTIRNNRTGQALIQHYATVTDPDSQQLVWKLQRIEDAANNGGTPRVVSLAYTNGRLTRVTDAGGRVWTFAYDSKGRIDRAYDPLNDPAASTTAKAVVNTYDPSEDGGYRVARQTLLDGTTLDFAWDRGTYAEYSLVLTINQGRTDQRVRRFKHHRVNSAWTSQIERAYLPNSTTTYAGYVYDANGLPTRVIEPSGRRVEYGYDAKGFVTSILANCATWCSDQTAIVRDSYGNITKITEPAGTVTEYGYNATTGLLEQMRRIHPTDAARTQLTQIAYDPVNLTPAGTTTAVATSAGLPTRVILPDGTVNAQSYDRWGYPDISTYDADASGRTGLKLTENLDYDWRGVLVASTDLQGVRTVLEYAQNPASGQFGTLGWPSASVLDQTTANTGRKIRTTYAYDAIGNLTKVIEDAGALNSTWSTAYQPRGVDGTYLPTRATDPLNQHVDYTYTVEGNVATLIERLANNGTADRTTTYQYTPEGWLSKVIANDGRTVEQRLWSAGGDLYRVLDGRGRATDYGYDDKGRVTTITNGAVNPGAPVNVAYGKPVSTSSVFYVYQPTAAVDGDTSTWTHTNNEYQPWWEVDLRASTQLTRIDLWNRTDCCGDRLSNFYVLVSDTPFSSTNLDTARAQAGVSSYYVAAAKTDGTATPVTINRSARYVRVQLAGTNVLTLAEVRAWTPVIPAEDTPVVNNQQTFQYDGNDRITQVSESVDGGGRMVVARTYDPLGRLATERDGANNVTTYQYDDLTSKRGWLTDVIAGDNVDSEELVTQYSYDRLGRMTQQVVDPGTGRKSLTTLYRYTATGSTDPWHLQQVVDPRGFATDYRYNTLGLLSQTTDAAAKSWFYGYDNLGALTTVTPPTGAATTYARDLLGRATSLTRNGQTERWAYHVDGTLKTHTDFAGRVATYGYDGTGRLTSIDRDGTKADAQFAYFANDQLRTATSKPDGVTDEATTYAYDAANRLSSRARGSHTVSYAYNRANDVTSISYWGRASVGYGYDGAGRVQSMNPFGLGDSSFAYRSTDLLQTVSRPAGNSVASAYGYDTASRLTSIGHSRAGANIHAIGYVLDNNGNRTEMTDEWGVTGYQYDNLNRLTQVSLPAIAGGPAAQTVSYGYDAVGNRISPMPAAAPAPATGITRETWTNVSGSTVSAVPVSQAPNQVATLGSLEGPTNVGDNYAARYRGYLVVPTSGSYTFWIASDDASELWLGTNDQPSSKQRLASVSTWTNSREWTKFPEQQSAAVNLVAGQRYYLEVLHKEAVGGDNLAVAWQGPGITQQVIPGSALRPFVVSDPTGITRESWSNVSGSTVSAVPVSQAPNQVATLDSLEGPTNVGDNYAARYRGYLVVPTSGSYTFWIASDDASELWLGTNDQPSSKQRLASVSTWTNSREWTKFPEQQSAAVNLVAGQRYYLEVLHKEAVGGDNLAVAWQGPGITQQVIPGSALRPWTAPGATVAYDASDRALVTGVTYDALGNMVRDSDGATYSYDAANRLIQTVKNGVTTDYQYDALGNLVRQKVNGVVTDFIIDESLALPQVLGEIQGTTETLYAYGPDGLHAQRQWLNGTAQGGVYPLGDGLGSIRQLSDANGAVTKRISYDAWGVLRHATGSGGSLGFTGEQQFADGTVYLRARSYLPRWGRFLQRDTFAGFADRPQSLNRYAYTENNPVNWTDPSGHYTPMDALDVVSAGISLVEAWQAFQRNDCDKWWAAGAAAADVVGAVAPFLPSGAGHMRRAANGAADASKGLGNTPVQVVPESAPHTARRNITPPQHQLPPGAQGPTTPHPKGDEIREVLRRGDYRGADQFWSRGTEPIGRANGRVMDDTPGGRETKEILSDDGPFRDVDPSVRYDHGWREASALTAQQAAGPQTVNWQNGPGQIAMDTEIGTLFHNPSVPSITIHYPQGSQTIYK